MDMFDRTRDAAVRSAAFDWLRAQVDQHAVRQRLHQRAFRERVLDAYRHQCAFCRFRHAELLDAAHIVPDADGGSRPSETARGKRCVAPIHG